MKKWTVLLLFLPFLSVAYTQDTGKITDIFVSQNGSLAIKINSGKQGIPNAAKKFNCTSGSGWVGLSNPHSIIVSAIMTAKTTKEEVVVTIDGCEGGWFKIKDMYIK